MLKLLLGNYKSIDGAVTPPGLALCNEQDALMKRTNMLGLSGLRVVITQGILALATIALLAGCGSANSADDGKVRVVTTTGQIGDIAMNVGGGLVQVESLMGPGVDPHLYVASESDVERLAEADVILYNGLHLEAQMAEVFEQIAEYKDVVAVGGAIDPSRLLSWGTDGTQHDPHIWFDVQLWMQATEASRDALIAADPENSATYSANADAYLAQLQELDEYVRTQANTLPAEQRILVTAHDAFGYFGKAYGFEVRGLQGISTASEAGTLDVRNLARFIADNQIPAIFIESSVPVRNVEALQAAVRALGWDVQIGGSLFSDAMGSPDTPEGTYIGMVRHNIDTIVSALKSE